MYYKPLSHMIHSLVSTLSPRLVSGESNFRLQSVTFEKKFKGSNECTRDGKAVVKVIGTPEISGWKRQKRGMLRNSAFFITHYKRDCKVRNRLAYDPSWLLMGYVLSQHCISSRKKFRMNLHFPTRIYDPRKIASKVIEKFVKINAVYCKNMGHARN